MVERLRRGGRFYAPESPDGRADRRAALPAVELPPLSTTETARGDTSRGTRRWRRTRSFSGGESWRRRPESNRRMKVLQTSALPLGYVASRRTRVKRESECSEPVRGRQYSEERCGRRTRTMAEVLRKAPARPVITVRGRPEYTRRAPPTREAPPMHAAPFRRESRGKCERPRIDHFARRRSPSPRPVEDASVVARLHAARTPRHMLHDIGRHAAQPARGMLHEPGRHAARTRGTCCMTLGGLLHNQPEACCTNATAPAATSAPSACCGSIHAA